MGFMDDKYKSAVEVARQAMGVSVEETGKLNKRKQELIDGIRADLNLELVPCDRDFMKTVMFLSSIRDFEKFDYFSDSVCSPSSKIAEGFNPHDSKLAEYVDKFKMRDGMETDCDRAFLNETFNGKEYTDGARGVYVNEERIYNHRIGYTPREVLTSSVNKVINEQAWLLHKGLEQENEEEIKLRLSNIRSVVALNNDVQRRWRSYVCDKIVESNVDFILNRDCPVIKYSDYKFTDEEVKKKFYVEIDKVGKKYHDDYDLLKKTVTEKMNEAIDNRDRKSFFGILQTHVKKYGDYYNTITETATTLQEIEKKYIALDKESFNKFTEMKSEEVINAVLKTVQEKPSTIKELVEHYKVNVLKKNNTEDLTEGEKLLFKSTVQKMMDDKKIRFDANRQKIIPMVREIKTDKLGNAREHKQTL